MNENMPLVTIVTVSFNEEKTIRNTMESVLCQTYPLIEYILVDGNSSDQTLSIIRSLEPQFKDKGIIFKSVSESDKGIYDAMNKGIRLATGKWINFMNAGDSFYAPDVLQRIFENNPKETLIYGDVVLIKEFGNVAIKPKPVNILENRMPFCHQTVFLPTHILKNHPFGLTYRIANDYKFFYDYYKRGGTFHYLGFTVANFEAEGGISSSNRLLAHKENAKITGDYYRLSWKIHFYWKSFRVLVKAGFKGMFPKSLVQQVRSKLYAHKAKKRNKLLQSKKS